MKKFKPQYIEGKPLRTNIRIEQQYQKKIESLTNAMTKEVEKKIKGLFEKESPAYFAQDASISSQVKILINALINKYSEIFNIEGKKITDTMISQADRHSKSSVKDSLQSMGDNITINVNTLSNETKEIIKASAAQSVSYIKSIQSKYFELLEGFVYRSITSGNGLQDLVPQIQELSGQTKRRAKNIALDQTRKTMASLNNSRMKKAGITKGKWRHSGGSADPRKTHQAMDGKVFDINKGLYDSAVSRYILPAQEPYCRCFLVPVIELDTED